MSLCASCGSYKVTSSRRTQKFLYGTETPVELSAKVVVWECSECGCQYTEGKSEDERDKAVREHKMRIQNIPTGAKPLELPQPKSFGLSLDYSPLEVKVIASILEKHSKKCQ